MSSQTDAENSSERPFQLVQKRSSGQGRRGVVRERPPHSKPQAQEDPPARSKRQYQKQERDPRTRSHSHGSHPSRSAHPSSSSSSHAQRQEQATAKGGGGGKEGEVHRNMREHSWENELNDKTIPPAKTRYERLSISEATTHISNRFEGLNPDSEAPGGVSREGLPEREKKPRGLRGRSHSGSKSPPRKGSVEEEFARSYSSDKLEESSKGELMEVTGSPVERSEVEPLEEKLDVKADDGVSAGASKSHEVSAGETVATEKSEAAISRRKYSRDFLLGLRHNPYSKNTIPKGLKEEYFREGKWCAEAWLTPQQQQQEEELQEESRPSSKHPAALSLIREHDPKHFGKVCLSPQRRSFGMGCSWKEMSSSSGGSSHAPSATPTANDKSDILSEERDDLFLDIEGPHPPPPPSGPRPPPNPNYPPGSSFQAPPPLSPHGHIPPPRPHPPHVHAPRVINHIPLRDRERKNWREKDQKTDWRHQGQAAEDEDEPEWMAFGPSDRSEVIELKGLEEHEREREARLDSDKPNGELEEGEDTPHSDPEAAESEESRGDGLPEVNRTRSSPVSEGREEGEGVLEVPDVPEVKGGDVGDEENEFILDGFDFSTGLSICQELASEDTEDPEPLPPQTSNPADLSNALMKALKVGGQQPRHNQAAMSMGSRPVNALTLEEIQARENIQYPPSSQPQATDHDQSAFNKLVAVLQSSGAIQEQKPQTAHQPPPPKTSHAHTHQPPKSTHLQSPAPETSRAPPHLQQQQQQMKLPHPIGPPPPPERKPNFGYLLEKELNFDDDIGPPPSFSTSTPFPTRELAHQQMRNRMELQPSSARAQTYHGLSHSTNSLATATPQQMAREHPSLQEKWMDELGGAWGYPETLSGSVNAPTSLRQMNSSLHDRPSPHSHQLAAQRQQQMATAAASRQSSNHWAIEMEHRRLLELQHIRERERMLAARGQQYSSHLREQKQSASKPNISLLPTAVMRHMYNTKPSQSQSQLSELSKSQGSSAMGSHSMMANRLDQELTSKASQTHSAISSLLNHSDGGGTRDYPLAGTPGSSRVGGPPASSRYYDPGLYHPQFVTPMHHGIPAHPHPYMH